MNRSIIFILVIAYSSTARAWIHSQKKACRPVSNRRQLATVSSEIDFQSDTKRFGRGEMHLSALLEEKDIVVIQVGSWYVDGVLVGDGPIEYDYCMVESLQVVWTHNCEHGVIRGYSILPEEEDNVFQVDPNWNPVEFGPEQLVARLPVDWVNEMTCKLRVPWKEFCRQLQDL